MALLIWHHHEETLRCKLVRLKLIVRTEPRSTSQKQE
jgi:hypothetical protein